MTLSDFLSTCQTTFEFASQLGVDKGVVYQWKRGLRKVPVQRCRDIVRLTGGKVTYADLRPNDWELIWETPLPTEIEFNDRPCHPIVPQ